MSGLGQMLNPQNTCYAAATVHCLVAMEVDLQLDGTAARGPNHMNLDQVLRLIKCSTGMG